MTVERRGPVGASDIATLIRNVANALTTLGNNLVTAYSAAYGTASAYISAPAVIKAAAGRLVLITVIAPGSAGTLTFNDTTTTGGADAANEIFSIPYNGTGMEPGATFRLNWPCSTGIVCSAMPTDGQVSVSYA